MDSVMESLSDLPSFPDTPQLGVTKTHRELAGRALLRRPPARFIIEFLPISNKGTRNHGMRISPHDGDYESVITPGRDLEYEIWRKWEDILWFQQDLETAYSQAAREKKVRLARGKGVKGLNGFYKQDLASSFESLPPGPLPSSVAQDIHQYLPRLSKRGTVFRASQKTIEQRQKEFRALVEALFSDDVPSLIKELRETHTVTDFFGLWSRDYDSAEKSWRPIRNSVTSSMFSSYFTESLPTLNTTTKFGSSSSSSPSRKRPSMERHQSFGSIKSGFTITTFVTQSSEGTCPFAPSRRSDSIERLSGSSDDGSTSQPRVRPRPLSNTSSDTASTHSDEASAEVGSGPAIVSESPITFNHNPVLPVERPSSVLEVLPEERELLANSPESYFDSPQQCRSKANSPVSDRKAHRTWHIVGSSPTKIVPEDTNSIRESWQTTTSIDSHADAILDGIGFTLPAIKEERPTSLASMATVLTTDSADAVLPREDKVQPLPLDDFPRPVSVSTFDADSDDDEPLTATVNGIPFPTLGPEDWPETPTQQLTISLPTTPTTTSSRSRDSGSSFGCPPSPTASDFSLATTAFTTVVTNSTITGTSLSIKASHQTTIITLRGQRDTPFEAFRQRLYHKFVGQEGIPLSKEFAVAMVVPSSTVITEGQLQPLSPTLADKLELHFIDTQDDWEQVVLVRDSNNVTLRILDAPRS